MINIIDKLNIEFDEDNKVILTKHITNIINSLNLDFDNYSEKNIMETYYEKYSNKIKPIFLAINDDHSCNYIFQESELCNNSDPNIQLYLVGLYKINDNLSQVKNNFEAEYYDINLNNLNRNKSNKIKINNDTEVKIKTETNQKNSINSYFSKNK